MRQEWRLAAKCTTLDPDAPFAAEGTVEERVFIRTVCDECPVKAECLEWALRYDDHGVCGGLNRSQRRAVQAERRNNRSCGTNAGYYRHRRRGEKPCERCTAAHTAAAKEEKLLRRREVRSRNGGARLPPKDTGACGTPLGYGRHKSRVQEPCEPCRQANYAELKAYKAAKRAG